MTAAVQRWQQNSKELRITAAYSPAEIAKVEAPKLRELASVMSVRVAELAVKDQLAGFLRYSGADWDDDMLEECALSLAHSNGHLSMAQWLHFWKRCKSGHFKWFGGLRALTPLVVEGWMREHAAECEHENEQLQIQADRAPAPVNSEPWEGLGAAVSSLVAHMKEQQGYDDAAEDEELKRRQQRIAARRAEWEGKSLKNNQDGKNEIE